MKKSILIIDDEENMRHMLTALLTESGYQVNSVSDGAKGLEQVCNDHYDFLFCDIRMPVMDGITFLKEAACRLKNTHVIMMSAYGSIDTAIEAMKQGAYDYISKPFQPDEILLTIQKALERERLQNENAQLKQRIKEIESASGFSRVIAKSTVMEAVLKLAAKVALFDTTVLITGDSGTGKELIARGIHYGGQREKKPLITINCGGIPETLLESEMFGYKKGAFTGADQNRSGLFEAADGGTIFLDEIGELPLSLQVKLLRVLQENEIRPVGDTRFKKIDVRVVAATSKNLAREVENGAFREDLYYRLNVIQIRLPALIERSEDIPILCRHFIDQFNGKLNRQIKGISPAAMALLLKYNWPGNVRELENIMERAVVLAEDDVLTPENLPGELSSEKQTSIEGIFQGYSLKTGKEIMENNLIRRALEATGGNRTHAAKLLEISHPSLLSKIKQYGIDSN